MEFKELQNIKDVDLGDKEPFDWEYFKEYLDSQKQLPITIFCNSKYLNHLANGENPKKENTVLSLEKEKYND